jgi:2-dehydropantoate 2-reductase
MVEANVLVVGGGAIGGVTAAKMMGRVRKVAVLDANPEHVRMMRNPGLLLDDVGTEWRVKIEAYTDPTDIHDRFDFALLTLKAPYLKTAIEGVCESRLAETFVSLGNGLVQELIAQFVGEDNLIIGTVEWGATNLGPGHLAKTTDAPFVIGEPEGRARERTRLLAEALGTVAEVHLTDNIQGQVWSKLLVNSTFSGLGVVSGLLYRDVVEDPAGREVALALWREGYDVGNAQGLEMERYVNVPVSDLVVRSQKDVDRVEKVLSSVMAKVGATKASMLQDLERGLPTEVDVINGAVAAKGRALGIETPLNSHIVGLVHDMEQGRRQPSPEVFAELKSVADRIISSATAERPGDV